ncbi:LysR family transcriptional regulator [Acinetobacter sp. 194]|uniref:LysR family transcriptional regulator n=1 Tax=Acinetobacter shaoyimingii TaxID=2715164 RepID=UPI00140A417A|nr:LysR family transcriptional regulator [Acinetobacter shaoyimingii]NHB59028.1 LysR family transcriptional regulator [Acinetobacter shaoyimingii]
METLSNIESFIATVEHGSFSAAARKLGLSPAAVSRNIAQLEKKYAVRLFDRNTRNLTLTPLGQEFYSEINAGYQMLDQAFENINMKNSVPKGTLKISMSKGFGKDYIIPALSGFIEKYPEIIPDFSFENRQVDLIKEGFDAAIGAGIELNNTLIARPLIPMHVIAVASPDFLKDKAQILHPSELEHIDNIVMRSIHSGKIRKWLLAKSSDEIFEVNQSAKIILDDTQSICEAAVRGFGIALLATHDVAYYLDRKELVRVLPEWYGDMGYGNIYYSSQKNMPLKLRVFIDYIIDYFKENKYFEKLSHYNYV